MIQITIYCLNLFYDEQKNWRVCSATKDSNKLTSVVNLRLIEDESNQILFDSSRTGYTCGLWMLFHYMTVASEHTSDILTTDVKK